MSTPTRLPNITRVKPLEMVKEYFEAPPDIVFPKDAKFLEIRKSEPQAANLLQEEVKRQSEELNRRFKELLEAKRQQMSRAMGSDVVINVQDRQRLFTDLSTGLKEALGQTAAAPPKAEAVSKIKEEVVHVGGRSAKEEDRLDAVLKKLEELRQRERELFEQLERRRLEEWRQMWRPKIIIEPSPLPAPPDWVSPGWRWAVMPPKLPMPAPRPRGSEGAEPPPLPAPPKDAHREEKKMPIVKHPVPVPPEWWHVMPLPEPAPRFIPFERVEAVPAEERQRYRAIPA